MNGPALLVLQLLDSHIDQIEQRRKRLPQRAAVDEAKAAHQRWEADRARLAATIAETEAAIEQAERAGAELDVKRTKLEAQLKTVIAPREAEALMSEIATLVARHGELDEVELTAMEQQAEADAAIAELDALEPSLVAALDEARAALEAALAELAAEETDARARRDEAAAALDDADTRVYDTARRQHGGIGIARLERHTCTACHVDLSQVEFEQVMHTSGPELPECPHCARFLVV